MCFCPEVASSNDVERLPDIYENEHVSNAPMYCRLLLTFARGFCGQRFTYTRTTEQVDYEALAFTVYKVVESRAARRRMLLNQCLDQAFCCRRQDKILERFVIPFEGIDVVDVELDCMLVSLTESV